MSNNRIRIAILSVHSSPLGRPGAGDTGGMSIYIRELTRELAGLGHEVDIYTRVKDPVIPQIIDIAPGARQIHIQAGEPADMDKLLVYSHAPDFACAVESFRRQYDLHYDIVFSNYWISGIAGEYLQSWWRVPHAVMFHTLGAIKNSISIGEDEPDLRIQEEKQIASYCHLIIASTENEKAALHDYYAVPFEKIGVVPCGVNLELFQPRDRSAARSRLGWKEGRIMLFVGRIEKLKGIDLIIQAMAYLRRINPLLIIAGEDGNRPGETENLKGLAEKLGLSRRVLFTGLVDFTDLPDYYNAADVCIFPSYYESFGLVPLESLACGTPVIATDVGDLRRIICQGENGFVVDSGDPLLLSEKIEIVLSETEKYRSRAEAIRSSVSGMGWQKIAAAIDIEFSRLIAKDRVLTGF
ncbi:MAG: glycosyltransferase [Dehalococcoidales bacterium]|nr:glycosyltransferase [Dehalococcoidales bacterium]